MFAIPGTTPAQKSAQRRSLAALLNDPQNPDEKLSFNNLADLPTASVPHWRQVAAETITNSNENSGSIDLSTAVSLGATGTRAAVGWVDDEDTPDNAWFQDFYVIDGAEHHFLQATGDAAYHAFSVRSRVDEHDIQITRQGTSNWRRGGYRVFVLEP